MSLVSKWSSERDKMLCFALLWLLFSLSNLANVSADGCSNTQKHSTNRCIVKYEGVLKHGSPFYLNEIEFIYAQTLEMQVSSTNKGEECSVELNVEESLKKFSKETEQSNIVQRVNVTCTRPARVSFCRSANLTANDDILYLFFTGHCRVTGADLAVWGRATDLQGLYLWDGAILQDNGETKEDLHGLFNIGTLSLGNLKNNTLPRMFLSYVWKKMAEMQLTEIQLGSELNILETAMPHLQSLEISVNKLTTMPDFPWCNRSLAFPRNWSLTFIMNEHYSEGVTINPREYRRFFAVNFNPAISDYKIPSGRLDKISLKGNQLMSINLNLFDGVTGLKVIDLSLNKLREIPEKIFQTTPELVEVNLAKNNLTWLNGKTFQNLKNLRKLNVGHNHIHTLQNGFMSDKLTQLEEINFENNSMHIIETHAFPHAMFDELMKINLRKNKFRVVPQFGFYVRNLETFDVSGNEIDFSGFVETLDSVFMTDFRWVHTYSNSGSSINTKYPYEFPLNSQNKKELNLQDNAIERFDLTGFNKTRLLKLEFILKVFTISLSGNPIHCDCKTSDLQTKLSNWTIRNTEINEKDFDTWVCQTPKNLRGMKILDVPSKELRCEKRDKKCPRECTCYQNNPDITMLVDCQRRNLTAVPDKLPNGMVELRLGFNQITNLTLSKSMENVTVLYASHNRLQSVILNHPLLKLKKIFLDSNKLTSLPEGFQSLRLSQINLQNNFFTCDCKNLWMKSWLKKQTHAFLGGAESVACSSGDMNQAKPLVLVEDTDFVCRGTVETSHVENDSIKTISSYVLAGFLFIMLVLVGLIYRFRKEIKLVLYTRFNWHPFDRVDDSDPSKIYDAFVSFNAGDREWVKENLHNKLENHNPPYKLCIHYRDFVPGAPIVDNILRNVKKSRRMIMVLSQNFIQSEWCMLEFRTAHRKVLEGRANYLIIVLFDDVNVDTLDDELKLYLRTNTYLSVQSKSFWQQLKYALPQKKPETESANYVNTAIEA